MPAKPKRKPAQALTEKEELGESSFEYVRAEKLLRFLLALNDDDIARALLAHGLSTEELDEGWSRLRALGRKDLRGLAPAPRADRRNDPFAAVEAWSNQWLPILRATLNHRYPTIAKRVLAARDDNSAEAFLDGPLTAERTLALSKGNADAREARALLARRGLTDEVLRDGLARYAAVTTNFPPAATQSKVVRADADERAWAWYQEWSAIARVRITDGRLLRRLGFGKRGRPAGAKRRASNAPDA